MGGYYDEVEIEDMSWDEEKGVYHYPCPCGDRFEITKRQLADYEDIATCPSCSLIIRVIYDPLEFEDYASDEDVNEDGQSGGGEDDEDEEGDSTDAISEDEAKDDRVVDALNRLDITQQSTSYC